MESPNADQLLAGLTEFQFLLRNEQITQAREDAKKKATETDVTGRWLGYDKNGMGKVEYDGRIYLCNVISNTCKQKYAKVNLRRTKTANYVDWQ